MQYFTSMMLIAKHQVRAKQSLNASPQHLPQKLLFIICFVLVSITCNAQITTPSNFLGYNPGADYHLATYEELLGYFEQIETQTDKIKVFNMGPTSEGRQMKYAIISSSENMAKT